MILADIEQENLYYDEHIFESFSFVYDQQQHFSQAVKHCGFVLCFSVREQTLNKFSCDSVCSGHTYAKRSVSYDAAQMSLVVRKPVFGVSDQVRHKPGCTTA